MPLPSPQKSTVPYLYKYSGPANLDRLREILLHHEIYLPSLVQLNDDNDGLPRLAMQSEQQMADFLCSNLRERKPNMSPQELQHEEEVIRFNVHRHGPAALHPSIVELLDDQLKDYRIYSMAKRYNMGNLWALYADGHRGYCLEFKNVGPLFDHAKDVNYLDTKDMEISLTEPSLLNAYFLFCKSREWSCEEEVRLVLSRRDGRTKVKLDDPTWLNRIILGKAMSDENKNIIRQWAKERKPELAVATTYYDAMHRAIKLRDD